MSQSRRPQYACRCERGSGLAHFRRLGADLDWSCARLRNTVRHSVEREPHHDCSQCSARLAVKTRVFNLITPRRLELTRRPGRFACYPRSRTPAPVGGIGLGTVGAEQFALIGVFRRDLGRLGQFEDRLVEILAWV
jgi:hypothetical protein